MSKKAWISLAESGLFNGLQRIQIKKFFPYLSLFAERLKRLLLFGWTQASARLWE
jgi:hypothetical protein